MRLLHCVLVHLFGTVVEAVLPRQQTPEISGKTPQCLCSLLPRPVRCKTPFRLPWFFNPKTQLCQKYQRGFCAGNTNSFSTCVKCMNRCSIIHAVETCRLIHKKVEEMKQHSGRRPK
ncbi:hypothetical protein MTO96_041126 [Rhipicephalus appendiculatus]